MISATTSVPEACSDTPVGIEKLAAVPTPGENPWVPPPASVVTAPVAVFTARMRWLKRSAT